jgi:hypothetical protein
MGSSVWGSVPNLGCQESTRICSDFPANRLRTQLRLVGALTRVLLLVGGMLTDRMIIHADTQSPSPLSGWIPSALPSGPSAYPGWPGSACQQRLQHRPVHLPLPSPRTLLRLPHRYPHSRSTKSGSLTRLRPSGLLLTALHGLGLAALCRRRSAHRCGHPARSRSPATCARTGVCLLQKVGDHVQLSVPACSYTALMPPPSNVLPMRSY